MQQKFTLKHICYKNSYGQFIKDVCSQGEVDLSSADKGGEMVLHLRTPLFLVQKTSNFFKFMVCSLGQRGWASADILRTKG